MIPEKYKHWVLLLWTCLVVAGVASAPTLLRAIFNVSAWTAVVIVLLFAYKYQKATEAKDPVAKIAYELKRDNDFKYGKETE